jgi:multidrug efflux pump subunit AcrA (membrane-fusion protein)
VEFAKEAVVAAEAGSVLLPGMTAIVDIVVVEVENVLKLPNAALGGTSGRMAFGHPAAGGALQQSQVSCKTASELGPTR